MQKPKPTVKELLLHKTPLAARSYHYVLRKKISKDQRLVAKIRNQLLHQGFEEQAYKDMFALTKKKSRTLKRLAAFELAYWHANKYTVGDANKSLEFLDIVDRFEYDPIRIKRSCILRAEAHALTNNKAAAKACLDNYLKKYAPSTNIYLAYANLETALAKKLAHINKALQLNHVNNVTLKKDENCPYNNLGTEDIPGSFESTSPPLVSVIIPAYNAADMLHVSIEAMLNQTYGNLEIIVADDCSTDRTAAVAKKFAKKDARVKLVQNKANGGPYTARNNALSIARGEFVTCHDSDDWSHPLKIQKQVEHLIKCPDAIANMSKQARATDNLIFHRRGNPGYYMQANMSSLMFRRKSVLDKLGNWDSVRFGPDSEFIKRIKKTFGSESVVIMQDSLLSFQRKSDDSLTGSSAFGYHGFFFGARKEYVESQEYWHDTTKTLSISYPVSKRPFSAPYPMHPERKKGTKRQFDYIIMADFRAGDYRLMPIIEFIEKNHNKKNIGLVQIYKYNSFTSRKTSSMIRTLLNHGKASILVYGEVTGCKKLIVTTPEAFIYKQKFVPEITAEEIVVQTNNVHKNTTQLKKCLALTKGTFGKKPKLKNSIFIN